MKKYVFFLVALVSCTILSNTSFAQDDYEEMTKQELKELEKEWKNRAKEYKKDPLALKELIDGYEEQIDALRKELDDARNEVIECTADKERLQMRIDSLTQPVEVMDTMMEQTVADESQTRWENNADMIYKVQIGAFQKYQNEYFEQPMTLVNDPNDGMNKYVIGTFGTEEEAETFKTELRRLGFSGAWVVPYKDGTRVPKDKL